MDIVKSGPFWAILLAHMGYNYGYETLMTELPTYMKQVLHFSIKDVCKFTLFWILLFNQLRCLLERFSVSATLLGDVAVLDPREPSGRLDVDQAVFHAHFG